MMLIVKGKTARITSATEITVPLSPKITVLDIERENRLSKILSEQKVALEQPVLFKQVYKHGFFHKHIDSIAIITSESVILQNFDDKEKMILDLRIPLTEISDILVVNQRVGNGQHYTVGHGYGTRSYYGTSTYASQTIGDIQFFRDGSTRILFRGVTDPRGVVAMTKSAKKYQMGLQKNVTRGMKWIIKPDTRLQKFEGAEKEIFYD